MDTSTDIVTRLDQNIAALKAKAADFDARHQLIEKVTWPQGVRIAVNFTADFDAMLLRRLANETPMQLAKGEFGGRVGIWRLVDLFTHHGVKATVFTPGRICELYPRAVKAASESGHEIADHMWEHRVPDEATLEEDHLHKAIAALTEIAGQRPVGTRSWHTQALLVREGFLYNSHGEADHLPYYERDASGGNVLLYLQFHYAIDDAMYFSFAWLRSKPEAQRLADPDQVFEIFWQAFWQQYRKGGYLNVCLHPFISGRALRTAMLDRLIVRMKSLPGVWFPTCQEVARYCLDEFPAKAN